jgi:hypothetical protein
VTQERTETRPPEPLPDAQLSWVFAAEAIFFVGVVIALVRWIHRTLVDVSAPTEMPAAREVALRRSVDNIAAKHLIARGLISTEELLDMSEGERAVLLSATARQIGAPDPTRPIPLRALGPSRLSHPNPTPRVCACTAPDAVTS